MAYGGISYKLQKRIFSSNNLYLRTPNMLSLKITTKHEIIMTIPRSQLTVTYSQFLPSHSIKHCRYYSNSLCSLERLSADIQVIYKEFSEDDSYRLSPYRLACIQQKIREGSYVLSPLNVKFIKKVDITKFLKETQADCPDIMIAGVSSTADKWVADQDKCLAVIPSKEDVLVLTALSLMLFRLYYARMPKETLRSGEPVSTFYYSLQQMGKVDRLYKLQLDLNASFRILPKSVILEKMNSFVGDASVYKLISSLFDIPSYDDNGNEIDFDSLPPLGQISRAIFNIVLMEIFDREFPNWFPGKAFSRFLNEVFISTRGNDKVIFNDTTAYALLSELCLLGKIMSIGPGDDPLTAYNKIVFIDKDSEVIVCTPDQYY